MSEGRGEANIRVLVVEDDEDDFAMARALLSEAPTTSRFEVEWGPEYRSALAAARGNLHDVYLVDYRLGAQDGVGFIREAIAGGCDRPLILMTGQPDRDVDMAAMAAGADDFLGKSEVTAAALERSIRYAIQKKSSERQHLQIVAEQAARAEAEAANQLKDEFLATLSHELRTPLNAILGWAQMLRVANLDPETSEQAVEAIERNAKTQAQLINDLLDVSRIISGKIRLERRVVSLSQVIAAAVESCRPAATERGMILNVEIDAESRVMGDLTRLQQVAWNLLTNAIKFTSDGGRVDVRVRKSGQMAEISVKDNGRGIRPEYLNVIFERFRQADSSSTRNHAGLGLGLAIVRHIVDLHGGTVRAYSEGEGSGAMFTVELPLATGADNEAGDLRESSGHGNGMKKPLKGLCVLVVDDEADARKYVAKALSINGAETISAGSAAEGIARIAERRPDVIVSDIAMPVEDGYQFLRRVRSMSGAQGGGVPAIALTAYASEQDKARSMAAGFQIHVTKPVEAMDLVAAVAAAAGRKFAR
ncbi:MAG TPA: response regulator [Tepidisphaeraceae bacterium]|jgi:signal transduction histidine kinase|nr:response regulator [Tepidisphaeraceae bacterium]